MKIIEINDTNFENEVLKEDQVLVDFNATWCGPCRMLSEILDSYCKEAKVKICSCDVDMNENLAMRYRISSIPCLILFNNGKETRRSVGLISLDELKEFVGD